jgi:threonyl-tRNA synthetase
LAPEQVKIVPVADSVLDYAKEVESKFKQN